VPLGGSRGPGSASGGLVAAKFVQCPKSYYTEQLENTVGYVINTIRRIIRLRRMTHPCLFMCTPIMA